MIMRQNLPLPCFEVSMSIWLRWVFSSSACFSGEADVLSLISARLPSVRGSLMRTLMRLRVLSRLLRSIYFCLCCSSELTSMSESSPKLSSSWSRFCGWNLTPLPRLLPPFFFSSSWSDSPMKESLRLLVDALGSLKAIRFCCGPPPYFLVSNFFMSLCVFLRVMRPAFPLTWIASFTNFC